MDQEFAALLDYYQDMLSIVDVIHFNSQNTKTVYGMYLKRPYSSKVISITHKDVCDCRRLKQYNHTVLRLGFIGSEAPYKGLPLLKGVINKLNVAGFEDLISLRVYGGRTGVDNALKNVEYCGRFPSNQMQNVYGEMDVLIVPSIWCETFGLTTIEALQFGVPSIVSSNVGAKDIVAEYAPQFVYDNESQLLELLSRLVKNRDELVECNRRIVYGPWSWSIKEHSNKLIQELYG